MITKVLDRAPRIFLYSLFLLLPVFLVPGINLPLDLHKQFLLALIVFATGVLWVAGILRKGEVSFRWHILFVPLGLFVLAAFISAFGSGAFLHSFWGANAEPDSFFNILLFALLFVLIANTLTKKEHIHSALIAFVAGAALSALFLFANSLFSFPLPFGSPFAFGVYAGGMFLVVLALILTGPASAKTTAGKPGPLKFLAYAATAILFLAVLFVSQWVAWVGIILGSLLLIYFLAKYQSIRGKFVLPLIILILSLVFWLTVNPFDNILKFSPEVRLGRQATLDIAKDTISSNIKNALFGSGPTTFRNQYILHRNVDVNKSPFWNLSFSTGSGATTSFFATTGVLGGGLILIFWIMFLWYAKSQRHPRPKKQESFFSYSIAILLGGAYFFIAWLLYETNFLLLFAGFSLVALWAGLGGEEKTIQLKKSSLAMFWGMAGSIASLLVLAFGFYTLSRNYYAEISYWRGTAYSEAKNYAAAISEFKKAAQINDFDKYWRKASQAIYLETSAVYRKQSLTEEQRNAAVQRGITAAESAAILATQANPKSSTNFEQLGDFYTNVIAISDKVATMPFPAYAKAASLNPQSPYIPLKRARAHLSNAKRFAAKDTDRAREAYAKAIEQAQKEAENALALKRDFVDAMEFLNSLPK